MTSITMESRCLDNLLPPGAQRQREADYLCLTATSAIMYHGDGSTVNTTGILPPPQPAGSVCCSSVFLTWRAGPAACVLLVLLELVGNSFLVFTVRVLSG